jgi:hypothetical protein
MRAVAVQGGKPKGRSRPAVLRHVRTAARYLDARLPTRLAMGIGAGIIIVTTFLYSRHVDLSVSWIPAAVAAIAGWCSLVVLVVTAIEIRQIWRGGAQISVVEHERHLWATQQWIPPLVLVAGILLGWVFFK